MKHRKAKEILSGDSTRTLMSLRISKSLLTFIEKQVESVKIDKANRNRLIEGILLDWAKSQGYKE